MTDRNASSVARLAESVWDYPRPPRVEESSDRIVVVFAGLRIAETCRALRLLETSHPPVFYIPPADIMMDLLIEEPGASFCEWKGTASYLTLAAGGRRSVRAAWFYEDPTASYQAIAGHIAFYPSRVDEAWVGDERVSPQPGDFYGGWITSCIKGPFKGSPGTRGW